MKLILLGGLAFFLAGSGLFAAGEGVDSAGDGSIKLVSAAAIAAGVYLAVKKWG